MDLSEEGPFFFARLQHSVEKKSRVTSDPSVVGLETAPVRATDGSGLIAPRVRFVTRPLPGLEGCVSLP